MLAYYILIVGQLKMISHTKIIVLTLLILCVPKGIVYGQEHPENQILKASQILFQESKKWKNFNSFPTLDKQKIKKYESSMRSLYMESKHLDWMEDSSCSLINRLFADYNKTGFRSLDTNGDGNNDIVYSGNAICAEGNLTIIWFGNKNGLDQKAPLIRTVQILKIEPFGGPRITSVRSGCCGDPIDEYFLGDIFIPSKTAELKVVGHMNLPTKLKLNGFAFKSSKEITIRSSPIKDDKYNKDMSAHMNEAVFGNIVAKYLSGAKGEIVATYHDSVGVKWGLFILDSSSRVFRFHNPYNVNVGWTVIE